MKLLPKILLLFLLFCFSLQSYGQKATRSNASLVKTFTFYKNADPSLNHQNYFDAMAGAMHLSPESKMVLTEESSDQYGYTHFKYQQFHQGLPIFGCRYILHEKAGRVASASGYYSPQANPASKPGIDAEAALRNAQKAHNAQEFAPKKVEPILCFVDPAFPKVSETLRLAYQVDVHSIKPFDKRRYFVDATSGKIITQFPLIIEEGVPSTAKTRYYGVQNIITDSIAPQQFILRDPSRGEGIFVFNDGGENFTNTSSNWDLTNPQKDEVALDAHFCTQEYYDMMLTDYTWQGLDGQGKALIANVHGGNYANAFWDGESSTYGDGDCNYGPLTTLEVIGHEFTHGMIDYTSKLVYNVESGAINESLADMFGKMLERKTDPANFSWALGHSFLLGPDSKPFRIMDDPKSVQMPAFYKGEFWEDFSDVHTNSSIGNLWFSMIVDGKQGVNEAGEAFNVPALGMDKAGKIVFQTNKNYLTENSDYNAFYQYSVDVAASIYGAGSTEALAVKEAWKAVGLPGDPTTPLPLDLYLDGDYTLGNNFCGTDQFLPVHFKVVNSSTETYNPSLMGKVILSYFGIPDYIVNLNSPIAPGEVFDIQVNNWLKATEPGFLFVSGVLDIIDGNPNNNYSSAYYNIAQYDANDLSLYVDAVTPECFANEQIIFISISNNSCETIPVGTVMEITATDEIGNVVWTLPYTLPYDLIGFDAVFLNETVPVTNSTLTVNLTYSNDPDVINNEYIIDTKQAYLPITDDYLNNFETNNGQDTYLELLNGSTTYTMLYQGNRRFGATGQYQEPDNFQTCADPSSVFDEDYNPGITASIHACVDYSFSEAPTLEFDLAQLRNVFTDTSDYKFSSMLQAKWTGNESGNELIFDQPEGVIKHSNIPLPPYFKGALDIKFYTEIGNYDLNIFNLTHDDFLLFDNLKLSAPTVGTKEPLGANHVRILPNPAREFTIIQAEESIKTIVLQSLSGQTLQTLQVNSMRHQLDTKELSNGFYLLNIQLDNGHWETKKLVKMN